MGRFLLLLIVVAVLIGAGAVYAAGFAATPAVPQLPTAAPAPAAPGARRPVPSAAAGQVTFQVSQATLSEELNRTLVGQKLGSTPLGDGSIRTITLALHPAEIDVGGEAQVGPATVSFSSAADIEAKAGRAVVTIRDARVANIPLPEAARGRLQEQLQQRLDEQVNQQGFTVSSVTIQEGSMTIVGSRS